MKSSVTPSSKPAPLSIVSERRLSKRIWLKKKRLRRLGNRLPPLPARRQVPRLSVENHLQLDRHGGLQAGLLLLRTLWPRHVAGGQPCWFDGAVVHGGRRALGQSSRRCERSL